MRRDNQPGERAEDCGRGDDLGRSRQLPDVDGGYIDCPSCGQPGEEDHAGDCPHTER